MDSSRILNTYAADGTKLRSVYKTNAATLLFPIGNLCEQEQVEYATRTIDYCFGMHRTFAETSDMRNTDWSKF